jgi:hypothetical protein
MICKLGQEYTKEFLERYDTYLMQKKYGVITALDNVTIVTKYCLRDLYDKKYEGKHSKYFKLYNYLEKDVKVVGIYTVNGMNSEISNISL